MREMLIAVLTNAVWLSTPVVGIAQDQTQIARGIQVMPSRSVRSATRLAEKESRRERWTSRSKMLKLWSPNQHAQYVAAGICLAAVYGQHGVGPHLVLLVTPVSRSRTLEYDCARGVLAHTAVRRDLGQSVAASPRAHSRR